MPDATATNNYTINSLTGAISTIEGNPITESVTVSATSATVPLTENTSTNAPSTQGMIRNLNQTCQEREIIKTAPDLVIYLDGKTYLLNPYITNTTAGQPYTFVSFNDYVQNFSASYDVDNLVPSGNFTLQIPNHAKYLFQAPGGNNLIDSMMEVQIFAKGYFASGSGNTIYHRIFKGVTSHVAHTDSGMFLEISVQCLGILHLLEYMYVDLNPANTTNSERSMTPMGSNQFNMNPYEILAAEFQRDITFEGFQLNSIQQGTVVGGYWEQAVKAGFANKFQPILANIRKEVHITGYSMGTALPLDAEAITNQSEDSQGSNDPRLQSARITQKSRLAQNAPNPDYYVDVIRKYLPDMSIGSLQLTNGRIVSRLERIRTIVQMIGFEGFQDLDGTFIFKPPLYNLDVTKVGTAVAPAKPTGGGSISNSITDANNPFIVNLSEIESESESEDEQAVKATRMTIQPSITASQKFISDGTTAVWRPTASHIDIPKMAKFGLREEPAKTLGWLGLNDKIDAYAYAVSELNRANRGWRTYNLTIPLRPELRLGFPMYLPHRDMYGYIKTISISYSYGGAATMTVMLDTLRKRPVFPSDNQQSSTYTNSAPSVLYTTQPNLVMEWTEAIDTGSNTTVSNPFMPGGTTNSCTAYLADGTQTTDFTTNLLNTPATQLQSKSKPIYAEDMEVVSARRSQYGSSWATKADTTTKNFRVQNDKATADDATAKNGNGVNIKKDDIFFSAANWHDSPSADTNLKNGGVNMSYLQKIVSCQPYTDEGGYELVTPFPWGRWKSLKEALYETHEGYLVTNPTSEEAQQITGTDVFLFAGVGTPSTDTSTTLQNQVSSATTFEIITPKPGDTQSNILADQQPDSLLLATAVENVQDATNAFLTGNIPPQSGSSLSLAIGLVTIKT